jgi:hypothetical protein
MQNAGTMAVLDEILKGVIKGSVNGIDSDEMRGVFQQGIFT